MKKYLQIVSLAIVLIAPFVLWALPASFFDDGSVITCPSVALFNFECIGCGMTRAVMHFHHFQYPEGIFYNYGVVIIYPLLVILWFRWLMVAIRKYGPNRFRKIAK